MTPQGGTGKLGTIRAITYSFDDRKLWLIDELPITNKKLKLKEARLLRASPGGDIEVLATWVTLGLSDRQFLSVDRDGTVLVTFALKFGGFVTARVALDASDTPEVTALYAKHGDTLHGAPFVSSAGYGFFVQHAQTDEMIRLATLPPLMPVRTLDESVCQ